MVANGRRLFGEQVGMSESSSLVFAHKLESARGL